MLMRPFGLVSDPAPLAIPPLWGFGGDGARAVATERICRMSHRNTPSKAKVAPAKRAKKSAKLDPAAVARRLVDGGFTGNFDYALQTLNEVRYNKWREYDIEDSMPHQKRHRHERSAGSR